MIDLRFVERDGKRILQWREIPTSFEDVAGTIVVAPAYPIYATMERNWTEWADVPTFSSCEAVQEGEKRDPNQ